MMQLDLRKVVSTLMGSESSMRMGVRVQIGVLWEWCLVNEIDHMLMQLGVSLT